MTDRSMEILVLSQDKETWKALKRKLYRPKSEKDGVSGTYKFKSHIFSVKLLKDMENRRNLAGVIIELPIELPENQIDKYLEEILPNCQRTYH